MSMPSFEPPWNRPKSRLKKTQSISEQSGSAFWRITVSVGLLLSLLVLLSGCATPVVVSAKPPAYPQLPQELLDYKPAAERAGLWTSPSTNVSASPTGASKTPSGSTP